MSKTVLKTENLGISFGGLKAAQNVNIKIKKNQIYGLIGPNGAGKTTVFNMLTGVYKPTTGTFYLNGEELKGKTQEQINRKGIARTFQNIRLFGNLSVMDNVKIALHGSRVANPLDVLFRTPTFQKDEQLMTDKVMHLLQLFKIEHKKDELAKNLPYGEQRKLEIVRALAANPSLLLLDEPAAGMNPQETDELMKLIAFIRKEFNLTYAIQQKQIKSTK